MNRLIKTWFDKFFNIPKRPTRWEYVTSNSKQTLCNNRLRRILPKIFCLFLFCGIANAEAWKGQVTNVTLDAVNIYGDGAPGAKPYIYTEIYDAQENKEAQVTPIKEMRVVSGHRLVGSTFANGFFDNNFWSTATVNSGYINVANGSIFIYGSTSTQVDGTAYLQSKRVARFVSGSANEFRGVVKISTDIPTTGINDMRWGLASQPFSTPATIDDGLYFRYSNGAFYVGYRVGGVAVDIATTSFNGTVPTITSEYTRYQIIYTNLSASFYVNDKLAHKVSATTTTLGHTVNFRARAQNYNSDSSASNNVLEAKVLTILRLGASNTDPTFKYMATGAASSVLKFGPGLLHTITVNAPGLAGTSIAVYDSTYTVASQIIGNLDTAKTSITGIRYDLPFSNGLWVVPTGDFGNVTIVYE